MHIFISDLPSLVEKDTAIVDQTWFWPILAITLAFVLSIISTLIILIYIQLNKQKSNDQSDVSSTHSTIPIPERRYEYSRHVEGFRSPPPPYTTCERPANLFVTSSPPPSYVNETLLPDVSSTLTSPSIQTFQA